MCAPWTGRDAPAGIPASPLGKRCSRAASGPVHASASTSATMTGAPCRLLGELVGDDFELAFYQREIGSRLIGLTQRQRIFVWHTHVMAERGYPTVKTLTARPIRRSCRDGANNAPKSQAGAAPAPETVDLTPQWSPFWGAADAQTQVQDGHRRRIASFAGSRNCSSCQRKGGYRQPNPGLRRTRAVDQCVDLGAQFRGRLTDDDFEGGPDMAVQQVAAAGAAVRQAKDRVQVRLRPRCPR